MLGKVSNEETLNESMSVGFPVAVRDDTQEGESTMVDDMFGEEDELADLVEVDTSEDMDLFTVEQERGRHGGFHLNDFTRPSCHSPNKLMANMLRAARVDPSYIKAAQIHR